MCVCARARVCVYACVRACVSPAVVLVSVNQNHGDRHFMLMGL
jgi:hypothetical protein